MSITTNTLPVLDLPRWRPIAAGPSVALSPGGLVANSVLASDARSRDYANPKVWCFAQSATIYYYYNTVLDAWGLGHWGNTLGGTVTAAGWTFVPSQGPSGTIAAGATTTTFTLSTALPGSVLDNQLADRGDGLGYIIRIVDNAGGASGKIAERRIVANTSGTTPLITVSPALDFTPTSGSRYEFLSGAIYVLSTGASKEWRRFDILTKTLSSALSTTNLVATVGTVYLDLVPLDEQHVPHTRFPGEGFLVGAATYDTAGSYTKGCLTATATAAGTITGQASSGDAAVLANQFRNFQIRIVEDTSTPTAVGQRRRITSHTAGASPVYTLASNWSVTPSSDCKYVVENDNDKIIFLTNSTTVYNYNIAANTWDTTTWAARGTAPSNGTGSFQAFGVSDLTKVSQIHSVRGVGTGGNPVDVLDIAAGATGVWSSYALTPNFTTNIFATTYSGAAYEWATHNGKYVYLTSAGATSAGPVGIWRLDILNRIIEPFVPIPITFGPTAVTLTSLLAISLVNSGSDRLSFLYARRPQNVGDFYYCPLIY